MLKPVTDYSQIEGTLAALLRGGMNANYLPNAEAIRREIAAGTLYMQQSEEGLLLLRRREQADRLNYLLHRGADAPHFEPERRTVLEIPYRRGDETAKCLSRQWEEQGFALAFQRLRMTRRPSHVEAGEEIRFAAPADLPEIDQILAACYSPVTACLPTREELLLAMDEKRLLVLSGAMLHFLSHGSNAEMRHLGVLPQFRNQHLGSRLIRQFLALRGDHICRVWVGTDNATALHMYPRYGYEDDGWRSDVRIFERT